MRAGKQYLVRLTEAPTIAPTEGGWAMIRYPNRTISVSPVVSSVTPWASSVHIVALENGPDPTPERDELVYRNTAGAGESRVIHRFTPLG